MKHSLTTHCFGLLLTGLLTVVGIQSMQGNTSETTLSATRVTDLLIQVNRHWQHTHTYQTKAFWDQAAYHTGNMEAYFLTGLEEFRLYSEKWAEYNQWKGAKSSDKTKWKYTYGETDDYVLFGDWQVCFQTYIDLYNLDSIKQPQKIARAIEVMEYQMSTPRKDYWWWCDGLYMVMPVMTKLYRVSGDERYLTKLGEWFQYADSLMYDPAYGLYYRDAKYIYPKQATIHGKRNFWSRGNGWVFAAFAKVLSDLPANHPLQPLIQERFQAMASALVACQQPEGYWTRSLLDPEHAPGYETSGTAFFTYGLFWGLNHGLLDTKDCLPAALKGWHYLSTIALQPDLTIGYVQPIGENPSPSTKVSARSTYSFGVGAWLLAACETARYWQQPKNGQPANDN